MRYLLSVLLLFSAGVLVAQNEVYFTHIDSFQAALDEHYANSNTSPLEGKALRKFKTLGFFPVNSNCKVEAKVVLTPDSELFPMMTSSGKAKDYRCYAELHFELEGKPQMLKLYQRIPINEKYPNSLFLPFTDETSGGESYGGGRYLDLELPIGETVILDFNKAYNPYCAYTTGYSCSIPPRQNHLDVALLAGAIAPAKR